MASGKLLRKLIKSGIDGDNDSFRQVSEAIINEERLKQHHLLANDLERILYGRTQNATPSMRRLVESIPTDRERGMPLLEVREPVRSLSDVVLSDENRSCIEELLMEHHRVETLQSFGMHAVDRILFCGPPGCGKTLTAEVVATELSRPLVIVRIDSVISSYLGETAASLRKVFDFISASPMVVLFDEFDALAKERSDLAEHGEIKRVVNAVLQMLDAYEGQSIMIAATNHEAILDSAVWRRFEEVLVFEPPNLEQVRKLLEMKLRGVRREFSTDDAKTVGMFNGMTYADVERVLRRAIKEMVLQGQDFLQVRHLENALRRENARRQRIMGR
jgi:SpoVK/Ycf46/Vps4 family AAA+-type ATPase